MKNERRRFKRKEIKMTKDLAGKEKAVKNLQKTNKSQEKEIKELKRKVAMLRKQKKKPDGQSSKTETKS